jgi:hypothetical protein
VRDIASIGGEKRSEQAAAFDFVALRRVPSSLRVFSAGAGYKPTITERATADYGDPQSALGKGGAREVPLG